MTAPNSALPRQDRTAHFRNGTSHFPYSILHYFIRHNPSLTQHLRTFPRRDRTVPHASVASRDDSLPIHDRTSPYLTRQLRHATLLLLTSPPQRQNIRNSALLNKSPHFSFQLHDNATLHLASPLLHITQLHPSLAAHNTTFPLRNVTQHIHGFSIRC